MEEDDLDSEFQLLLKKNVVREEQKKKWKLLRGLGTGVCIVICVASWVTLAQLLRNVNSVYKKPFFQAYFMSSFYTILYVCWKIWIIFPGNFVCNRVGEGTLTNFKYLGISTGVLGVISLLCAATWLLSLPRTSLSANTAVYQSASAVVFILSIPVLRERVSVLKFLSVGFTIAGVSLISVFTDEQNAHHNHTLSFKEEETTVSPPGENTPLGYAYLTTSTILFAMLEVGFKKFATKPDDPAPVQNSFRVLGYIGVHTLLWMWPLLVVLHFSGLEPFEFPDLPTLYDLLVNTILDMTFILGIYVCIALSSPLITSVGTVMVIPATVMVDWLAHDYILPWQAILGIVGVLAGFFALVFAEGVDIFYWQRHSTHLKEEKQKIRSGNTRIKKTIPRYLKYLKYIF